MTDMGWFDEIIEAGALNNTDLTDVRFLVNHNTSNIPLARSRRNTPNSTMQLMPDQQGLSIRVNLDTENNAEAKSLYSAVQRGDISGMSFMFSIDDEEWENMESDHPIRHIRAIGTVVEVSAVTFPAYEATEIYARSKEALESAKKALENAREGRASDTSSVDTELQLLQMRSKSIFLKGGK
jgi:HK97 family phage prohead protease